MNRSIPARSSHVAAVAVAAAVVGIIALAGFSSLYAGKIYPGVKVNGIYVGGLSRDEAIRAIRQKASQYNSEQIPVQYNSVTLRIPVSALGVQYSSDSVDAALDYGRQGSLAQQMRDRLRAMIGRGTLLAKFTYDDSKLTTFINQIDDDVTQPVANAQLKFTQDAVVVSPSRPGHRLDRGQVTEAIDGQLGAMTTAPVTANVYALTPTIDEAALDAAKHKADAYVSSPLTVVAGSDTQAIDQATILGWVDVGTPAGLTDMLSGSLKDFYSLPYTPMVNLSVNQDKIGVYVDKLAGSISKTPQNAMFAFQDGKVTIGQSSHDGVTVDKVASTKLISDVLAQDQSSRTVTLAAKTVKAAVNEQNLAELGVVERISEGQTFFPGSPSTRLTNVRVGAAKYNGVLLSPGEVFSFGKILGDVGPEQGYVPELVILDNHEEKQYGGGLCQVSSTAYRAALLAGLPIIERHNHSFAVSYYTAPFGVPGVDATIYYPAVDFKFKNDTGHALYIQTKMDGTTLTFDYFGTKTKTGEIRGPQFISGTTDSTQPSHTVFWRDVKDLSGAVIKTDQIDTFYESSKNFPITKQFN